MIGYILILLFGLSLLIAKLVGERVRREGCGMVFGLSSGDPKGLGAGPLMWAGKEAPPTSSLSSRGSPSSSLSSTTRFHEHRFAAWRWVSAHRGSSEDSRLPCYSSHQSMGRKGEQTGAESSRAQRWAPGRSATPALSAQ